MTGRPIAVSLFDESGNMLRPWAERGYECHMFDLIEEEREPEQIGDGILIWHRGANLDDPKWSKFIIDLRPSFAASFAPCDDVAVSGSKHFAGKLAKDPECQNTAARRVQLVEGIADEIGCMWLSENPVSVVATLWRKPNHYFDPCDYGGYLPEDDVHPRWPEYLPPRDAYRKKTSIWCGNGFVMPPKRPITPLSNDNPGLEEARREVGQNQTDQVRDAAWLRDRNARQQLQGCQLIPVDYIGGRRPFKWRKP